jgi:hypothetical protein
MAKILAGIGITDIRQFGEVTNYAPAEIRYRYNGKTATKSGGNFYVLDGLEGHRDRDVPQLNHVAHQ